MDNCWGPQFTEAKIEKTRKEGRLLTMELELSRMCNLRCIYCYAQADGTHPDRELTLPEIKDALIQARELGAVRIIVLGGGEPLLYPEIKAVLDFLAQNGLEIELFTNATRIDLALAQFLAERKIKPVVKFNSLNPRVQDLLAGKKGAAGLIRQGLDNLFAAGYPDVHLPLGAQTIICAQNYRELPAMWTYLREKGVIPYFETLTDQGRACGNPGLHVPGEELKPLFEDLARIDRERFGHDWAPKPPIAAFTCRRHLFSCTVTSTGEVFPCPGVTVSGGNIREKWLQEIISNSRVFQDLRDIHKNIKGKCAACEHNPPCYGCRGAAYQLSGDYLAEDPLCWLGQTGEEK
ncbi:MAG: radical SAM/SPASM domain-containing protein [Desulfonatronovibrionaceae bacterium]